MTSGSATPAARSSPPSAATLSAARSAMSRAASANPGAAPSRCAAGVSAALIWLPAAIRAVHPGGVSGSAATMPAWTGNSTGRIAGSAVFAAPRTKSATSASAAPAIRPCASHSRTADALSFVARTRLRSRAGLPPSSTEPIDASICPTWLSNADLLTLMPDGTGVTSLTSFDGEDDQGNATVFCLWDVVGHPLSAEPWFDWLVSVQLALTMWGESPRPTGSGARRG